MRVGGTHRSEQIEKGFGKSLAQMPRQKGNPSLHSIPPSQSCRDRGKELEMGTYV